MDPKELIVDLRYDVGDELRAITEAADVRSLERLEAQVAENPGYADLRFYLARRYVLAGRLDNALVQLDEALSINSSFAEALRLKTRILTDQGDLQQAIRICQKLTASDPADAEAFLAQAMLHSRLGDHAAAIGAARNAVELRRSYVEAHAILAEQYLCLEDFRLARRHFEIAERLQSSDELAYMLALVCLKQEDVEAAEKSLWKVLELNPRHLNAAIRLAKVKIAEGDYQSSYRVLSDMVGFYPMYPDLQYGLARVCLLMGRRDEAYQLMKAALELNPRYAEVRREIASLYDNDQMEEAADQVRQSIEIDPDNEQAVVNLGFIYSRQGEVERAIDVLENASERFPDSWRILQSLGILQLQKKAYPKAKLALAAASQINPELESIERSLRIVFRDESLLEDERRRLTAQFSKPDQQPELYHRLGRIHLDFHQEKIAAQFFRQSYQAGYEAIANAVMLATVHGNRGDFDAAIRWLEGIEAGGLIENVRRILLGLFQANSGDHELSTRFYQLVMNDSPLLFHALDGLCVCFYEQEELDDMLDDYLDYARYNERNAPLLRRIGLAYANKGMLAEARQYFEHATILDQTDGHAMHALGVLTMLRTDLSEALQFFRIAVDRAPDWPIPHLCAALVQIAKGDAMHAMLSLQRYVFLEQTECWRTLAEKMLDSLNPRPAAPIASVNGVTVNGKHSVRVKS